MAVTALVVIRAPVVVMACRVVLVVAVVDLVPGALLAVPDCGAEPPQAPSSQRAVTSVSNRPHVQMIARLGVDRMTGAVRGDHI